MRQILSSFLLLSVFVAALAYSQVSLPSIEGRVLRAGTLEPIPNVQVRLTWPNASIPQTPEAIYAAESLGELTNPQTVTMQTRTIETRLGLAPGTLAPSKQTAATTDAEGRFVFKDAGPGQYRIRVQHDGYLPLPGDDGYISTVGALKELTVEVGKPIPRAEILLTKGAVITGRILDPSGNPIPGITVAANRLRYLRGRPVWDNMTSKQTDDKGEYRLFWLQPEEYYISAAMRATPGGATPSVSWERTFYPGVTEAAAVTPVIVRDGAEVNGISFSVLPAATTFTISGTATNALARPNPATGAVERSISTFFLSPRQLTRLDPAIIPQFPNAIPVLARPNGEFEIQNVRPGSYDLYPQYQDTTLRRYLTSRTPVEVRNSNVSGLTIAVTPGVTLTGEVLAPQNLKLDTIRVSFWPVDTLPGSFATIVEPIPLGPNGQFTATNVPEARYRFTITGLPENAYIADVRQDGASVYDTGFTLSSQSRPVQIVVNAAGGTVEGIVLGAGGKPAAGAYVTLAPPVSRAENIALYKSTMTDDAGRFVLKAVPPGPYSLFSFDAIPWGAAQSAEFHAKYRERGRSVTITAERAVQAELNLISVPSLLASPPRSR